MSEKDYIDLLEIDTFRVVKDTSWSEVVPGGQNGRNNTVKHWIAHMCDEYIKNEDYDVDQTGAFDSDEIKIGRCYYCEAKIPEGIVALWSMLEWEAAGDILHFDGEEL